MTYHHNLKTDKSSLLSFIPIIIVLVTGIAYAVMGFYMPPIGDDLGFINSFVSQNDCWYSFPRYCYRHWLWNNGRFADMLTPIFLCYLPLWLRALTYGLFIAGFLYMIMRWSLSFKRAPLTATILLFLVIFTFRWDAIWMEFCASYNYIFTSAVILLALYFIKKHPVDSSRWYWWLTIPFNFLAGACHEAAGASIALTIIAYSFITPYFRKENTVGKLMILALIVGGLFTLTSSASYSRVNSMLQPENPLYMLLFSGGYVLLLLFAIIYLLIRDREKLLTLIRSDWFIFATGAFISSGFMLLSQYGGRTGWFAQTFTIIALFQIISDPNTNLIPDRNSINKKLYEFAIATLFLIIVLHLGAIVRWQIKLGSQTRTAIELLKASKDGVIFMDYTNDPELPWYLLRKTHGVPDADDTYYRYRMSRHYGDGKKLVILPQEAQNLDWQKINDKIHIGDGILTVKPISNSYTDKIVEVFPRTMVIINGREYVQTDFNYNNRKLYFYSPVDRDPGEK